MASVPNTFLALRLSDDTRDLVSQLQKRLQRWELPASWVDAEDLHLTVLFLGPLSDQERDSVPQAIELVASSLSRPHLRMAGLGASGGQREPRVVYVALEDAGGTCRDLHDDLSAAIGDAPVRDFLPHITICRPRSRTPADAARSTRQWPELLAAHGQADWGACTPTDLVLYQRQLERRPRYRALASWPLNG